MDLEHQLVRNSRVQHQTTTLTASGSPAAADSGVLVDVVVLSGDLSLFEAIRLAIGERNPVWRARSAEESVELLLTGRCGVLLIDMAVLSTEPATLVEQIVERFPNVVIVVAGRRDDVALLARLISDGLVYRFMHKPLSPKRAGMFLNAAIRCHVERQGGRALAPQLPLTGQSSTRIEPRGRLYVAAGLLLFVVLLAALLLDDRPATDPAAKPPVATAHETPAQPVADPVLSSARAALAAGRYEAPPGHNALDLFAAVLLARPGHPEARAGLDETATHLVALATSKAQAGEGDEARRLAQRVLAVDPGHASARALQARLDTPPAPVTEPTASLQEAPAQAVAATAATPPATPAAKPAAQSAPAAETPAIVAAPVTKRRVGGSFGPSITSGHPTAGYVRPPSAAEPVVAPTEPPTPTESTAWLPDQELEQLTATEPVYPRAALHDRIEGWVKVDYTVTESGSVDDIEIVEAEPQGVFEAAAKSAVGQWRFRPRVANGRPVPQRLSVTLRFNVEG